MDEQSKEFCADWASPPGDTICDLLEELNMPPSILANQIGMTDEQLRELLCGRAELTAQIATRLEEAIGSTARFWSSREQQFLASGHERSMGDRDQVELAKWLQEIPLRSLAKLGWLSESELRADPVNACFKYFGVASITDWMRRYRSPLELAAFRSSPSVLSRPGPTSAWLRRGEMKAGQINCSRWDAGRFQGALADCRRLTRISKPERYLRDLRRICSECGVAVVVSRSVPGCTASGAAWFPAPDKAAILLSFRHRTDDHFWFSFFHEAAHLVLHAEMGLFVEDEAHISVEEERAADRFAERTLIPADVEDALREVRVNSMHAGKDILRLARHAGVSPGIIVGQLQHRGIIGFNRLNDYKRRIDLEELASLEEVD